MSRMYRIRPTEPRVFATVATLLFVACACGQPVDRPVIGPGEVAGNDVYVRSGPSLNHYPICKLNAGHQVTVLSERGNWYEILPPDGTFSLIAGQYVDTVDNRVGVVNGNNVRVRAGSQLDKSKYTVQTKLSKGAEVEILGENPDGFLKIKPPKNATLWVSRDYVELLRDRPATPEHEAEPSVGATETEATGESPEPVEASTVSEPTQAERTPSSSLAAIPSTTQRKELEKLDEATRAEIAKPAIERNLKPLADRYKAIAENDSDDVARQYATMRLDQIKDIIALTNTILRMDKLDARAEHVRREYRCARANMYEGMEETPIGLDAKGELRLSATYAGGMTPKRYRLVDPSVPGGRTVAYIEVPSRSSINVEDYLGRYVGVRASKKRLLQGTADPVPVLVASEFVQLERPTAGPDAPVGN